MQRWTFRDAVGENSERYQPDARFGLVFGKLVRLFGQPVQIGFQKPLNLSVEHFLKVTDIVTGASVFHSLVRM